MHRLRFHFHRIGDQVAATPFPENWFHARGEKLIIADERIWAFRHNPYVVFASEEEAARHPAIDVIPDCRVEEHMKNYARLTNALAAASQAEFMGLNAGIAEVKLRHPRLYVHEDARIVPDKVVVHTTGSDRTRDDEAPIRTGAGEDAVRVMSDEVIASILRNYADWQVVQVGAATDKPLGGNSIDRRGRCDYLETAAEIASAARFIGVNSGPMHLANCYPRVDKRIVLMEFPRATLFKLRPGDIRNWLLSWIDPASMLFNRFEHDVGLTHSHTKI